MRRVSPSPFRSSAAFALLGAAALLVPVPARTQQVIGEGGMNGRLERTDGSANSRFYDEYRYRGRRGERLIILLKSTAFDAALVLRGPGRAGVVQENDDDGRSLDSRIEYTLPARGTYVLRASSFSPGATGGYNLTLLTDRDDGPGGYIVPPPSVLPPPPPPPPSSQTIQSVSDLAGTWTYTETVGEQGSPYFCDNYGLLFMEGDEDGFSARFQQKGECTIAGGTASSAGTFAAARVPLVQEGLPRNAIRFRVAACVYTGEMVQHRRLEGMLQCTVHMPGGAEIPVAGTWVARRQ